MSASTHAIGQNGAGMHLGFSAQLHVTATAPEFAGWLQLELKLNLQLALELKLKLELPLESSQS